jgi:hypothetical protein
MSRLFPVLDRVPLFVAAGVLLGLAVLLSPRPVAAQGMCPGEPLCREVPKFTATITEFRVSPNTVGNRPINVTVRFTNRTAAPLILGYVDGTAAAFDDRGNKYEVQNSSKVRGIGIVERNRFDPKFTLGPGESSDAKLEVNFFVNRNVIVGTAFDFEMGIREIEPVAGNQYQLGREHALSWQSLANGSGGRAPAAGAAAGAAAAGAGAAATPAAPVGDPCLGVTNCASSGPVLAKLVGVAAAAPQGNNQTVTVRVSFQNLGSTPLILNYKQDTGEMLDEKGQKYTVDSRYNDSVQGMPVSTRDRASSQFTLRPGEARTAAFIFRRFVGNVPPGTVFSPSLAVEQYELLPSNQLKLEREHSLSFGEVRSGAVGAGGANAAEALKTLGDLLKKKKN